MEGWEDDGWGAFDSSQSNKKETKSEQVPATLSSGGDFFDTFETKSTSSNRTSSTSTTQAKGGDFFDAFESSWSTKSAKKEKTPPPLVSSSLFASGGVSGGGGGDGWGDWDEDLPSEQVKNLTIVHNIVADT